MHRASCEFAAEGEGHSRGIVVGDPQQPEDGVVGIVEIAFHGSILTVGGKRILRQIVRAETHEVHKRRDEGKG